MFVKRNTAVHPIFISHQQIYDSAFINIGKVTITPPSLGILTTNWISLTVFQTLKKKKTDNNELIITKINDVICLFHFG